MGMGGKRTTSIRRAQEKTYHNTGYGPFRPQGTNQTRNRRFEIRLFRNPVTTMRGWEMETSGLPIQDNAGRRMQLRYTRQRTISDNPGFHGMETIPQREPETSTGSHGPQELSYHYDDKGTKQKTSKMEDTFQSMQLPNRVPTRKRGRKNRCHYEKSRRSTYSRRQTTYKKLRGTTPKRMLGHTL